MPSKLLPVCLLAVLILLIPNPAGAQDRALDHTAQPDHGTVALSEFFAPDPYRVPTIIGGGEVDANARGLGQDCFGFISVQPDVRITAQTPLSLLRLIFIADTITSDTTLVVRDPNGRFLCNNNYAGLFNPLVDIPEAVPGDYAVWVGGFSPGGSVFGELFITGRSDVVPGSTSIVMPLAQPTLTPTPENAALLTPVAGTYLDGGRFATHGRIALGAGFLPDPFWTAVIGGGNLRAPAYDSAAAPAGTLPQCGGYTTSEPDLRLDWSWQSTRLRVMFVPVLPADANPGLVIQAPDGSWSCSRDFAPGYRQPMVEFINPLPGTYGIWVTHEDQPNTLVTGAVYITEKTMTPETIPQAATSAQTNLSGLIPGASAYTAVTLGGGFPDPYAVPGLSAGGDVDIAALNFEVRPGVEPPCEGYFNALPSYNLILPSALPYLRLFFVSDTPGADATLIVRMPDGLWYCGDDSFGGLNPTVDIFGSPAGGEAQVWVGSWTTGELITGTLTITRGSASPLDPTRPAVMTSVQGTPGVIATPAAQFGDDAPRTAPDAIGLNPFGEPTYGSVSLSAGFSTLSHTLSAIAGGVLDARLIGGACTGYISGQPDYRLEWSGETALLRVFFTAPGDAALAVYGPDGRWHCNDDSFLSESPTVDIDRPAAGTYLIWLASKSVDETVPGVLHITENAFLNPTTGG